MRIAKGSGTTIQEVNQLLKQFEQTKQMMKNMNNGKLQKLLGEAKVLAQEPMASHTTFKIGGPADYFVKPETVEELAAVAPRILYGVTVERLPLNSEMLATVYCDRQVVRWNGRDLTMCPIYSTKEHKTLLQEYCPQAHWVDLGGVIENK